MVSFSFLVTRGHTITSHCHASRLSSFASHYVSANIHPFTAIIFEGLVIIHDQGVGARRVEGGGGGGHMAFRGSPQGSVKRGISRKLTAD